MLNLVLTTDKLALISSAAASLDAHCSFVDLSGTTVTPGKQNTAITTAATTDIVASPAASTVRNVKTINVRNKHATVSCDVTIQYNANATLTELHKVTLLPGDALEYIEGVGFFTITAAAKLKAMLRVGADVTNATVSFADITGLTCPVVSGVHYNFLAHLYHISNATTTGAQFGIGGVAMTAMRISEISTILGSATAGTFAAPVGDITAINTAAIVETTGAATVVLSILSGWFQPSANGTFAIRCASEVAVASGLIVKQGSFAQVWASDN